MPSSHVEPPTQAHEAHEAPQNPLAHWSQSGPVQPALHVHAPVPARPSLQEPPGPQAHAAQRVSLNLRDDGPVVGDDRNCETTDSHEGRHDAAS